jgi:hypothetical protein
MDENKKEIQNSMKELKNTMFFQDLDERIPKEDIKMQRAHENKGSIQVEQPIDNKQFSSGFNSNNGVNYDGGSKSNSPKNELKNFDGTNVFTWVNQIE